jgi:hypothetical protein
MGLLKWVLSGIAALCAVLAVLFLTIVGLAASIFTSVMGFIVVVTAALTIGIRGKFRK